MRIEADGNFHNKFFFTFVARRSEQLGTSSRQFAVTHRIGVVIIVTGIKFNLENTKAVYHWRCLTVSGDNIK